MTISSASPSRCPTSKKPSNYVPPAEHERAFLVGQLRVFGHELLDERAAVGQSVLQGQVVEQVGERGVVQLGHVGAVPPLEGVGERLLEARIRDELDQRGLEIAAPFDQIRFFRPPRRGHGRRPPGRAPHV
ncbi:MAG TPA: hypothetical protein VGL23_04925 [Chloroflexota bacterium]